MCVNYITSYIYIYGKCKVHFAFLLTTLPQSQENSSWQHSGSCLTSPHAVNSFNGIFNFDSANAV